MNFNFSVFSMLANPIIGRHTPSFNQEPFFSEEIIYFFSLLLHQLKYHYRWILCFPEKRIAVKQHIPSVPVQIFLFVRSH